MKRGANRIITGILAIALVGSVASVVYFAMSPAPPGDPYTEFYILGENRTASEYPTELKSGETGTFIVGVTNHEHRDETYTVVLRLDNRTLDSRTMTIKNNETWEDTMSFSLTETGRLKLQILLFKGSDPNQLSDPYRHLRLWVNVSASRPPSLAGESWSHSNPPIESDYRNNYYGGRVVPSSTPRKG